MPGRIRVFPFAGPRVAISSIFLVAGLTAGTWFSRIPAVTSNLDLDKGQIGSLLLFLSVGSLVAFQVIGRLVLRFGSARVTQVAAWVAVATLPLLAVAPTPFAAGVVLFLLGIGIGSTGVAMNAQGVTVQTALGRPIMSSLHGFFTLGTLVGSVVGGVMAELGVGPSPHFAAMTAIGLVVVVFAAPGLLADVRTSGEERGGGISLPPRALWPLGVLTFCAGLGEGSMYDWSALYVHDELGAAESTGALAFATFSLAMLIGRFAGDAIVARLGTVRVVRLGSLIAATGLSIGLAVDTIASVFIGFACLGIGLSAL